MIAAQQIQRQNMSRTNGHIHTGASRISEPSRRWISILGILLVIIVSPATIIVSQASEPGHSRGLPKSSSDLFQTERVWSLHLKFTAEEWAAMEPEGGMNPFDPSGFGFGMFLAPAVMRDGDKDMSGNLSADEFRGLADRWFASWDRDGKGSLDSKQVRSGLKGLFMPPGQPGEGRPNEKAAPPFAMGLQGSKGKRNGLSGMMGIDFKYVRAALEFEGDDFRDVAVRYKGNGTFMESRASLKRPLKIDLNKFIKGQKLAGVTTLNLHNNVTDAGMMHEVLAFDLYRDAGVPAPRTAYARVFVTVPGKHDRKYFGLYSLVENVDKNFAADRKLGKGGVIFKPSMPDLFNDLGKDWKGYEQSYDPKSELTDFQMRRVIEFCRLVTLGTDQEFAARLGEFVDIDEFARFMAVSVWIGDLDSILTVGQNYYLYLEPKENRFQFIPWDKDHTFGSWGGRDQSERVRHSIREPWEGRKRFLERSFKVDHFNERYMAAMRMLADQFAVPERIEEHVQKIAAAIRPFVEEESKQKLTNFDAVVAGKPLSGGFFGFGKPSPTMLTFVKERAASVKAQLDGKGEGQILGRRQPGDEKGRPGPPPFEEMIEPALMKALDADESGNLSEDELVEGFGRWFMEWDESKAGSLSEDQLRKGFNKALPFSFFGPPKREETKQEEK